MPVSVGPTGRILERLATPALLGLFGLGLLSAGAEIRGWTAEVSVTHIGPTLATGTVSAALLATWLAFVRWREDRHVLSGRLAIAVPCLVWFSQSTSSPVLLVESAARQNPSALRIGAAIVGSWLVACDLVRRDRPVVQSVAVGLLLSVGSALALAAGIKWGLSPSVHDDVQRLASTAALPTIWVMLGLATLASDRPPRTVLRSCLGIALLLLAAAQVVAPPGLGIEDAGRSTAAAGIGLASVLLLLGGLSFGLRQAYDEQRHRLFAAEFEAAQRGSLLEADRLFNSCKAHDQKAALLAIEAVIHLLEKSEEIDPDARHRLCHAATDELRRLRGHVPDGVERDLRELVEPVVALATAAGANVTMKIRPGLLVTAGPELVDVVRNLITNAVHHGGDAEVTVEARRFDYEFVELLVTDRGPGIGSARRFDLFEPGSSSGGEDNSGLGLHSARSLLRAIGGDLQLDRSYVGGARFAARFPALAATRQASRV
jgi:signal transduction histidine kinase